MSSLEVAPEKKTRTVAVALLVLTFVVGAIAGVVADRLVLFRQHRLLPTHGVRMVTSRVLNRLDRELDLTPPQRRQIGAILEKRQQAMEKSWTSIQPQVRAELERTDQEIQRTLNPEQRKKFIALRDRWRKHARAVFDR